MNTTVANALAESIAGLVRVTDAPTGVLGYGRDKSCVTDCDAKFSEVDPNEKTAIGQALLRRLITPRGRVADDKDYGFDLRGYCNRGVTQRELAGLRGNIYSECLKDERVSSVDVAVVQVANSLTVTISVKPFDPNIQPFPLVFSVTSGEVLLATL